MSIGRIPQEVIDSVLKHHDIVDVVGKYVHLTKQGKYMKGLCPFHSEKTPSFTVTPEKQIFYCYGCHAGGTAIQFLMNIEGFTFAEAVRHLAEEANLGVSFKDTADDPNPHDFEKAALYEAYQFTSKLYRYLLLNTEEGKSALLYLRSRGISDTLIEEFQIGYAPAKWDTLAQYLHKRQYHMPLMEKGGLISSKTDGRGYVDRFRDRIIFPICDAKGRVIAFAGRTMADGTPKYLNSPETVLFNKSRNLYNMHQAKGAIRKTRQIVLFEGYVDVIKAWEAGVANGTATMGTSLTEEHAVILRRNADEAIICYDGDDPGQAAAYKNIAVLENAGLRVKVAIIPNRMDPDEYISSYGGDMFVREILDTSVTAAKFKLHYLRKQFNLNSESGRFDYLRTALGEIAPIDSPTEREHYLRELSFEFRYSLDSLQQELGQIRRKLQKKQQFRDNKTNRWNNVMNDGRAAERSVLLPAFHNAERQLLALMIHDKEIAQHVQSRLGLQFNIEAHAALAAEIYAYYEQGNESDPAHLIAELGDNELEGIASLLSMTEMARDVHSRVIDDYIRQIEKVPQQLAIERLKEEVIRAERAGDVMKAAQIANEIISLEQKLKRN